jgi:hypothetical protein
MCVVEEEGLGSVNGSFVDTQLELLQTAGVNVVFVQPIQQAAGLWCADATPYNNRHTCRLSSLLSFPPPLPSCLQTPASTMHLVQHNVYKSSMA